MMKTTITFRLALVSSGLGQAVAQLINPVTRFDNITFAFPNTTEWPILQTDFAPESMPDCGEESYVGHDRLVGRRALVTGGDSGLGRAITIAYMREGATVAINYLPEEEVDAQDLADFLLEEFPDRPLIRIPGNLLNQTFCDDLVERAVGELGGLDILVNNAGLGGNHLGPNFRNITTQSREEFHRIFETNLFVPFYLTQAAVPHMRPGSSLIYMGSGQGTSPTANALPYSASKAALKSFMSSVAMQLAPYGIRSNAVAPGAIYTSFPFANGASALNMTQLGAMLPFGRIGQPVEVSPLFVALADQAFSYTSGSVFGVHGAKEPSGKPWGVLREYSVV